MASPELSRRVRKVVPYPPLSEMSDLQRREFHEAPLDADSFEDLPGHGAIQRAVSICRRLPREVRRELGSLALPNCEAS
jgi:hypothetical protein